MNDNFRLLASEPENWNVRITLVKELWQNNDTQETIKIIDSAPAETDNPEHQLIISRCFYSNNPDKSKTIIEQIIHNHPDFAPAYIEKARILFNEKQTEQAKQCYKQGIKLDNSLADNELAQAIILTDFNEPEENEITKNPNENLATEKSPYPETEKGENIFYPDPGYFPVMPVSNLEEKIPLINVASLPSPNPLNHTSPHHEKTSYLTEKELIPQRHHVYIEQERLGGKIPVDYQTPEKYQPYYEDDYIQVVAKEDEQGRKIATPNLNKIFTSKRDAKEKRAGIARSLIIAIILHIIIGFILTLIIMTQEKNETPIIQVVPPPEITETHNHPVITEETITEPAQMPDQILSLDNKIDFKLQKIQQSTDFAPQIQIDGALANAFAAPNSKPNSNFQFSLFGSNEGHGFYGEFFDFKQDPDRKSLDNQIDNPDDDKPYYAILKRFKASGFDRNKLSQKYYKSKKSFAFTFLNIPMAHADIAINEFDLVGKAKPNGWIIHYAGKVSPPKDYASDKQFRCRFWGYFDDTIYIAVNGRTVLESTLTAETKIDRSFKSEDKMGIFVGGKWFVLKDNSRIDIIIGERPGGAFGGALMIEEYNKDYETYDGDKRKLPIFTTARLAGKTAKMISAGFNFENSRYQLADVKKTPVFRVD